MIKKISQEFVRQAMPGMRVTNQRTLILDIIRQGKGHMDADEVYRLARKKNSRISLSTVYRNLQTLKKLGLVDEVHFDEAHHHYEIKTDRDASAEHHHMICLGCGKIIEFKYPLAQSVKQSVPEAADFEITGTETRILGYCAECQRNRK
jgi:Fur family transcriptional regulator, ferric uptake regulator